MSLGRVRVGLVVGSGLGLGSMFLPRGLPHPIRILHDAPYGLDISPMRMPLRVRVRVEIVVRVQVVIRLSIRVRIVAMARVRELLV